MYEEGEEEVSSGNWENNGLERWLGKICRDMFGIKEFVRDFYIRNIKIRYGDV